MEKSHKIKKHTEVTYLECILDNTLSGESMAIKAMDKIGGRLKFLYRKQSFLTPTLRRLLCKALIQPILIMHVRLGMQT